MLSPSTPLLPVQARRLRQARLSKRKQVACVYKKPGEQRKSDSRHSEAAGDGRDTGEKSHKELRRYSIISQIFFLFILFSPVQAWLVVAGASTCCIDIWCRREDPGPGEETDCVT